MNLNSTDERESGTTTLRIDEDSEEVLEGFFGVNLGRKQGNESGASL